MKNSIIIISLISSILIISFSSCKKDNDEKDDNIPSSPSYLFKISFEDNYLCQDCGPGIIFLSDNVGNVIAEQSWTTDTIIEFLMPQSKSISYQYFTVTILKKSFGDKMRFISYQKIEAGTSWVLKGNGSNPTEPIGEVGISFSNIPIHDTYYLSSRRISRIGSSELTNNITTRYYNDPLDLLLILKINNGIDKYKDVDDVLNNTDIDLEQMQLCDEKTINIEAYQGSIGYYLSGYNNTASCNYGKYIIGQEDNYPPSTSLILEYPSSLFNSYTFHIYERLENISYGQSTYGNIPNSAKKINAEFIQNSSSPSNFQIDPSGVFDRIGSNWLFEDESNDFIWLINGPADKTQYALPQLPSLINIKYPFLNSNSFIHQYTTLSDYEALSSYQEYNKKYFEDGECFSLEPKIYRSVTKYSDRAIIDLEGESKINDYWEMLEFMQ